MRNSEVRLIKKTFWIVLFILVLIFLSLIIDQQLKYSQTKEDKVASASEAVTLADHFVPILMPQKNSSFREPFINTKSAYLIDIDSAYPMYAKNENQKMSVASTTKMMTAIVVLENYSDRLNETVTITPKMINVIPSVIQLRAGEKITVESLLNGLLIMSGNDAAYSLADYFGGKDKFVQEMNQKVKDLGLINTQFKDPAGLDDEGYSTAKELAIIASYALRLPKFSEIVSTPQKTISSVDGRITHELTSSNRLIRPEEAYYMPEAIGIKTGFTYEAGHVLVSAAKKNNNRILSIVLNTNEVTNSASAKESKKLLEWGFNNWSWK